MSLMTELGTLIKSKLNLKQDTLVSGTNIKTINNANIIGSGNIEISAGSGGGYSANVYLTMLDSSTVSAYRQISYTPQSTETQLTRDVNNNEVLIESYIFDGDVNTTSIPAGEWGFHYYSKVDNIINGSFIRFELFKRSSEGTETVLFSKLSNEINNTEYELSTMLITQPSYDILITDRIGIKVYASTNVATNIAVSFIVGNGRAAYFTTPLQIRHSQLRARNEVDSHPMSAITNLIGSLEALTPRATSLPNRLAKFPSDDGSLENSNLYSNSAGDLGLNVTPSSWHANIRALETLSGALFNWLGTRLSLIQNAYHSVGDIIKYKTTGKASMLTQEGGEFKFYTAPQGTAETTVTFTERMKIDNLGILTVNGVAVATATDIGNINSALDTINGVVI